MTTIIVCQTCDEIVDMTEGEKVEVLYGICPKCDRPSSKRETVALAAE